MNIKNILSGQKVLVVLKSKWSQTHSQTHTGTKGTLFMDLLIIMIMFAVH